MKKIIMWNVVTLDGSFEGKEPWDLSFHQLVWGPELEARSIEQLQEASALLFGEDTYKGMADYWPKAIESDPEVATLMNAIPKIVCSGNLTTAEWNNTTILSGTVEELSQLKEQDGGPIYVFGSAKLGESLLNAGLLDEIRLCVAPIILGYGRKLFTTDVKTRNLELISAEPLNNGGTILKYNVQNG